MEKLMPLGPNDFNDLEKIRQFNINRILSTIDANLLNVHLKSGIIDGEDIVVLNLPLMKINVFEEVKKNYLNAGWKSVAAIGQELDEGLISTIILKK